MQKQTIKRIHSFIALPLLAFSFGGSGIEVGTFNPFDMPSVQINMGTAEVASNPSDSLEYRAALIDSYFAKHKLPLAGFGKKMVIEADKHNLDWRLLPAIGMQESTGGKFACEGKLSIEWNPWGWNSCKGKGFKSMEESIETIARVLSGNHEGTAHYYRNKDVKGILETWNPPYVAPTYAKEVMRIMDSIGEVDIATKVS